MSGGTKWRRRSNLEVWPTPARMRRVMEEMPSGGRLANRLGNGNDRIDVPASRHGSASCEAGHPMDFAFGSGLCGANPAGRPSGSRWSSCCMASPSTPSSLSCITRDDSRSTSGFRIWRGPFSFASSCRSSRSKQHESGQDGVRRLRDRAGGGREVRDLVPDKSDRRPRAGQSRGLRSDVRPVGPHFRPPAH
jgi:hypothetical protein